MYTVRRSKGLGGMCLSHVGGWVHPGRIIRLLDLYPEFHSFGHGFRSHASPCSLLAEGLLTAWRVHHEQRRALHPAAKRPC